MPAGHSSPSPVAPAAAPAAAATPAPAAAPAATRRAFLRTTFATAALVTTVGGARAAATTSAPPAPGAPPPAPAATGASTLATPAGLGLTAGPDGTVLRAGRPYRGLGVNYFDCFLRTLKDGADTSYDAGFATLAAKGLPFARFCATGFWPKDMDLYRNDRAEYFRRLDGVVRAAERHGVGLIPSLFWLFSCVPDLAGEPIDQWGNEASATHRWMRTYVAEVVGRYRASPALWAWELGNEYNLAIDLPTGPKNRPKIHPSLGTPATRTVRDELRLAHLQVAARAFARAVRELDPHRLILTGHSWPRPAAWHLAHERSWTRDDEEQFAEALLDQNPAPIDLLSVHLYDETNLAHLDWLRRAARRRALPICVGEFGVKPEGKSEEERRRAFPRYLRALVESDIPLAALWVFDYPRQKEWNVTADNERAGLLDAVAQAHRTLARPRP